MSKQKIVLLIISAVLLLLIAVCFLIGYHFFRTIETVSYDINEWKALQEVHTYLPTVEDLGAYTDLKFVYRHKDNPFSQPDVYTIRASYSDAEFEKQIDWIESTYVFQEAVSIGEKETTEISASFAINDFDFRMLSVKEYHMFYPKWMAFVGISQTDHEIVFIFSQDVALDYIEDSLEDFLIKKCGWE